MAEASERKAFKDWFDREAVEALADQVAPHAPAFDRARFRRRAAEGLEGLEMMDRVRQMSDALRAELPEEPAAMLGVIEASLPPPLQTTAQVTEGYLQWPIGQLIADHGTGDFEVAMRTMEALTQRFSAEFAVRPLLVAEPERVCAHLLGSTGHPSPHVRRWCSEGARPRLPWGARVDALVADPAPILPILEALRDDPEEYVRRSVANNLNDIAKDHPELVVGIARRWWRGASEARRRLVKHALRTLVKAGHRGALAVLGYEAPEVAAALAITPASVAIGGSVALRLELQSLVREDRPLLVDYRVWYVKARGPRPKVFKWKELELAADGAVVLEKKHPMRVVTTRALTPGEHRVDVVVNGEDVASARFTLTD